MKSRTTAAFRRAFEALPEDVRGQARRAYAQFRFNPQHPGPCVSALERHGVVLPRRFDALVRFDKPRAGFHGILLEAKSGAQSFADTDGPLSPATLGAETRDGGAGRSNHC